MRPEGAEEGSHMGQPDFFATPRIREPNIRQREADAGAARRYPSAGLETYPSKPFLYSALNATTGSTLVARRAGM